METTLASGQAGKETTAETYLTGSTGLNLFNKQHGQQNLFNGQNGQQNLFNGQNGQKDLFIGNRCWNYF